MQRSVDDTDLRIAALSLARGARRRLSLRTGHNLVVQFGRLWLTCEGDPRDHILEAGQVWRASAEVAVLVEAIAPGISMAELTATAGAQEAPRRSGGLGRRMQLGPADIGLSWSVMHDGRDHR